MKKRFVLGSLLMAGTLMLAACGGGSDSSTSSSKEKSKDLVVSTFGLSEDIVKSDVIKPFEEEFSAKVTLDIGNSGERFTKLVNNPASGIDAIELAQANSADGGSQDLFEKIDEKKVPNIAD